MAKFPPFLGRIKGWHTFIALLQLKTKCTSEKRKFGHMANDLNLMSFFMEKSLLPAGQLLKLCPKINTCRRIVVSSVVCYSLFGVLVQKVPQKWSTEYLLLELDSMLISTEGGVFSDLQQSESGLNSCKSEKF